MSEVTLVFDVQKVLGSRQPAFSRAQVALDLQIIKDSNFFCPEDVGTLQASAIMHSRPGKGLVQWVTPYAREQYYERPNKSLDRNPNAQGKWFEAAKARWLVDWVRLANQVFHA